MYFHKLLHPFGQQVIETVNICIKTPIFMTVTQRTCSCSSLFIGNVHDVRRKKYCVRQVIFNLYYASNL